VSHLILVPILLPLVAGMTNLFLRRPGLALPRIVSAAAATGALVAAALLVLQADTGGFLTYALGNWPAPFGIVLVLDRLSALMLLTTAILAVVVLAHAWGDDDTRGPDFHVIFPLQLTGINGAFLTGDMFNLFVFFEILLIASYCLAVHGSGPERTRHTLRYVVLNLVGSSLFLIALGTLYGVCGTLNMADLALAAAAPAGQAPLLAAAALLLVTVFGLKAAVLPLFTWLPGLYAAALPSVAALFAIMTKVGVYAILRILTLIFPHDGPLPEIAALVLPLGLATLVWGALGAMGGRNLRETLAYLVIVSVGTLLAGIGLWSPAGIAAALYYLPHSTLVTAGLFLLAGRLPDGPATADNAHWTAPAESGPAVSDLTGAVFLLGAVATGGLPPLSGFIGKVLLLQAASGPYMAWVWTVVLGGSLLVLAALARVGSDIFWKSPDNSAPGADPSGSRLWPAALLILAGVAMAALASPITRYTNAAAAQLVETQAYIQAVMGGITP
jgi:multicomponent K+:H+ antiporter subunit D